MQKYMLTCSAVGRRNHPPVQNSRFRDVRLTYIASSNSTLQYLPRNEPSS